jgi:phosphoglycolate phosphatase
LKKLILYDFDGVLADTLDNMLSFAEQACAQLGAPCQPSPVDLEVLEVMDMVSYGRQLGVPEGDLERFADTLRDNFLSNPEPTRTFPGIREVLTSGKGESTQAIITGNARDLVLAFLHHHGLQEYIQLVYSGDMPGTRQHKILKAMRDAGARSQDTCLVSDAVSDIRQARQVGIHSIAVTWGYQSQERLASYRPDAIASTPAELVAALDKLCGSQDG